MHITSFTPIESFVLLFRWIMTVHQPSRLCKWEMESWGRFTRFQRRHLLFFLIVLILVYRYDHVEPSREGVYVVEREGSGRLYEVPLTWYR